MIERDGHQFTHKGWFGLCPVYFAGLDTEAPVVDPRHWLATPLMLASELVFSLVFAAANLVNPDFEAAWPLKVTGTV